MKVVENIYLKALEIGYNSGDEGISLNELKNKLKTLGYKFNYNLFRNWFYRSFEHDTWANFITNPAIGVNSVYDEKKLRLYSDSLFQYLEYIELKEARANSITAKKDSKIAILIALLSLLVSLIFSVINFFHQPKPDKQTESQLRELIGISIYNQKILDSCIYELKKLHSTNAEPKKTQRTEPQKK